jgi:hypothetical protein
MTEKYCNLFGYRRKKSTTVSALQDPLDDRSLKTSPCSKSESTLAAEKIEGHPLPFLVGSALTDRSSN